MAHRFNHVLNNGCGCPGSRSHHARTSARCARNLRPNSQDAGTWPHACQRLVDSSDSFGPRTLSEKPCKWRATLKLPGAREDARGSRAIHTGSAPLVDIDCVATLFIAGGFQNLVVGGATLQIPIPSIRPRVRANFPSFFRRDQYPRASPVFPLGSIAP
jgi:hypothetical protein